MWCIPQWLILERGGATAGGKHTLGAGRSKRNPWAATLPYHHSGEHPRRCNPPLFNSTSAAEPLVVSAL